jgi:uncharacterized protein (TIGR02147 family)
MVFEYASYRNFLRNQLVERITKNPRYSLRAMSRDLGLHPSHLSSIHSGKANLSIAKATSVGTLLGLSHDELEYFCLLVELELSTSPARKSFLLDRLNAYTKNKVPVRDLSVDHFKFISDWYHLAILELTQCADIHLTPELVAERLGITVHEAAVAIDRLQRLELLVEEDGRLTKASEHLQIGSNIPHGALRAYHRQMLEKAVASLETQTPEEKYIGSETLAISPEDLPLAHKLFAKFRQNFVNALTANNSPKTEVYHLGLQLFRVSAKLSARTSAKAGTKVSKKKSRPSPRRSL